ncbi:MAG TPA: FtsX-like permease family protein, partial [Trebonia sp.]
MTVLDPPAGVRPQDGGVAARRAVLRWAWRLFRREWRQQLLVLALVIVAVGATVIGAAVLADTPPPANSGYGTASDLATYHSSGAVLATQVARLRNRFGAVDVIENETENIPGSVSTYQLRAQDPHGPFGQPMLSLVSGRFPATPGEVALSVQLTSNLGLQTGGTFRAAGVTRRIVGIVQNPQSLLDEFALVIPGQVTAPTEVSVLFNAPGTPLAAIGPNVSTPQSGSSGLVTPETISIAGLTVGMLLIALVAVGGFTVLAQRRLRSLGMLASLGATDRQVGLVVRANGAVTGAVGAVIGVLVGLAAWFAYRPSLEQSAHHLIGVFALPWLVIVLAMVLAV